MENKFAQALDEIISNAPEANHGAAEVAVVLYLGGNAMTQIEGAVRKHATVGGLYIATVVLAPRQGEDPRSAPKRFADQMFSGEQIAGLIQPKGESLISQVKGGLFPVG